jgi:hypothetical protein
MLRTSHEVEIQFSLENDEFYPQWEIGVEAVLKRLADKASEIVDWGGCDVMDINGNCIGIAKVVERTWDDGIDD